MTALRWLDAEANRYGNLIVAELRRRPARVRTAVRTALAVTVGATLMATLQIQGPLGPVALFVGLYASGSRTTPRQGLTLIAAYAATFIASLVLAGMLIDAPWLLLPVVGLTTGLMTYGFSIHGLTGPWLQVEVGMLDTFLVQAVDPESVGWTVAHTFAGCALAIMVLVAFDMVLWPDPAERTLLRSLADATDAEREALTTGVRDYLEGVAPSLRARVSTVPAHLPLLQRARRELRDPDREAILLAAVTNTERLHNEVEHLLAIAREDVSRDPRAQLRPELEAVVQALAVALRQRAERARLRLQPLDAVREDTTAAIRSSFDALEARGSQLYARRAPGEAAAIANLASLAASLRAIGDRLLAPPLAFRSGVQPPSFREVKPSAATRAAARRQSIRIAVAATLAYVVCLASHRADLSVILWTAILAGLPTYGATLRRMFLRFAGAGLGGVLSLAVIIAVSPNFDTVSAYAPVFFIVMFVCAYVGLASGRLAYAGQQAGLTFIVMYYALSPRTDAVEPLWRMWGVFVGLVIVSAVFLLVMPEYAANNMPPRLARLLRDALELIRPETVEQVSAIHTSAIVQVNQLLAIADDARLERKYSGLDPDRMVDAAGTLLRIVDRLSTLAKERLTMPPVAVPAPLQSAMAPLEAGLREHLQRWLDAVERRETTVRVADLPALRDALRDQLSEPVLAELAAWPPRARRALFSELESYRRAAELVIELDGQLPAVIPR